MCTAFRKEFEKILSTEVDKKYYYTHEHVIRDSKKEKTSNKLDVL